MMTVRPADDVWLGDSGINKKMQGRAVEILILFVRKEQNKKN